MSDQPSKTTISFGWRAAYDNARSRNMPHETARLYADQWQNGAPDKLAWLRENIDYNENAPGAFYPEIFSDERGSIRCDGLEWNAGDDTMHFTKPMEVCEIEDFASHAWAVNCAISYGPMWKRRTEQLARIRENGKKEPVLLEVGDEMHVSPAPGDELRPVSSLTLDQAHGVVRYLSGALSDLYTERRLLWKEVDHWREEADYSNNRWEDYLHRTSREAAIDLFYAIKADWQRVCWKIKDRFSRRALPDEGPPF